MKIISLVRDVHGIENIPKVFTVGVKDENIPEVKSIAFYETGAFSGRAYRGGCYVITFMNSTVKRVIPSFNVIDIAIETVKETVVEEVIPPLPE